MEVIRTEIELPKELLLICRVKESEIDIFLKKLIAVELYKEEIVSMGKAAEIAGISKIDFIDFLRERKIPVRYGREEIEKDIETLKKLELW